MLAAVSSGLLDDVDIYITSACNDRDLKPASKNRTDKVTTYKSMRVDVIMLVFGINLGGCLRKSLILL